MRAAFRCKRPMLPRSCPSAVCASCAVLSLLSAIQNQCLSNGTGASTTWGGVDQIETMLAVSRNQLSLPPALAAIGPVVQRGRRTRKSSVRIIVGGKLGQLAAGAPAPMRTRTDGTVEPLLFHSMPAQPDRGHPGRALAKA